MSLLQDFLNSNLISDLTYDVCIGNRIVGNEGQPLMFKIKPITFSQFNDIKKRSTYFDKSGVPRLNESLLNSLCIIENTIEPNFKSSESLLQTNSKTPEQYLNKVLLSGEIDKLTREIFKISGFSKNINEMVDYIKN